MQFLVLGYDGTDERALERRLAVREAHLERARRSYENGEWLYACAMLDEDGKMNGSMIVCEFPSRAELEQWLDKEPYVTGNVWERIEVHRAQVAPFWAGK
jgi:uncharacterized protein YciI